MIAYSKRNWPCQPVLSCAIWAALLLVQSWCIALVRDLIHIFRLGILGTNTCRVMTDHPSIHPLGGENTMAMIRLRAHEKSAIDCR